MDQLDEKANESHDGKANGGSHGNFLELYIVRKAS